MDQQMKELYPIQVDYIKPEGLSIDEVETELTAAINKRLSELQGTYYIHQVISHRYTSRKNRWNALLLVSKW